MNDKFNIKDLWVLKYVLGFKVAKTQDGIYLFQRKYALDLIHGAWLIKSKHYPTPMHPHLQLHKTYGQPLSGPTACMRLIGILLHLTHSELEIAYGIRKLIQCIDAPLDKNMLAGFHMLRYLKNNPWQGLFFISSSTLCLKGFSDSDWWEVINTIRLTTDLASH